ncbi:MAG: hypothetical protein LUE26_03120 [Alistipes sp.]|nr:hypothetical protein [Alistipes sp.]
MKSKKKRKAADDVLKASRRGSREAEIELYGKPLPRKKVHASKKKYDRKRDKAGRRGLPYDFFMHLLFS